MAITPHSPSSMWYSPTPLEHPSKEAVWETWDPVVPNNWDAVRPLTTGGSIDMRLVNELVVYAYPHRLDVDYIYTPFSWPIFSTRLVERIESFCPDNIQKHRAPLYDWTTKKRIESHDFWVVNIVNVVECIDWDRCTIKKHRMEEYKIKRKYTHIDNLVLDDAKIQKNIHILRLREFPTDYFFSQSLYDQFVGMQLRGIAFTQHGVGALKEANPLTFRP